MKSTAPQHLNLETLERQAAQDAPSAQGAAWITTQALADLSRRALDRDPRSDQPMPSTLLEACERLGEATARGPRPLPHDALWNMAAFTLPALERILAQPRGRIVRQHQMLPTGRLKELDTRSMTWLSRQTGRTLREKVASTGKALGVTRRKSHDTQENRLAHAFLTRLWRQLESRHDHLHAYQEDALAPQLRKLRSLARGLRHGPLAEAARPPQGSPNNTLISDPDYGRVWRAWGWMGSWEQEAQAIHADLDGHLRPLLLLAMTSALSQHPDVTLVDQPCRDVGGQLQVFDQGQWGPLRRVRWVLREACAPGLLQGTIKMVSDGGGFGFITDQQGRDHHLHKRSLGDTLNWGQLKPGLRVLFSSHEDKRGWHARDLSLEPRATLWELRLTPNGAEVYDAPLDETGIQRPALELVERLQVVLEAGQAPSEPRRGLGLRLRAGQQATLETFADQEGLAQVSRWWHELILGEPARPPQANGEPPEALGLALLHGAVDVSTPSRSGPLHSVGAHTWHFQDPTPHASPAHFAGPRRQLFALGHRCGPAPRVPADDLEHSHEPLRVLAQRLRRTLGQHPQTTLAYTVPDGVDEFSLRALRAQMGALTPRALPLWRSVAAALEGEALHPDRFKPGQRALVLDLGQSSARVTPLLRRKHHSAPHGLWERHPSLPEDEWSRRLSLDHLLSNFLAKVLAAIMGTIDERNQETFDALVRLCMDLGVSYSLLCRREPVFLPLEGVWISLHPDDDVVQRSWKAAAGAWRQELEQAFKVWRSEDQPLAGWLREGKGRPHLLLAGWVWEALPAPSQAAWRSVTAATSLSPGALEAARREHRGEPAWLEWVPDLMMEVTQRGLYDEVRLLNGQSLEAHLGTEITQRLREDFVLPSGARELRFALSQGHPERHLLHRELRLRASAFPLERATPVTLTLRYRYGLEDSYTLQVEAVDPDTAGFQRVQTCWDEPCAATGQHSQPPPFPRPALMDQRELEEAGLKVERNFEQLTSGRVQPEKLPTLCKRLRNSVYRVCRQDSTWAGRLARHRVIPELLDRMQGHPVAAVERMSLVVLASLGLYAPSQVRPLLRDALQGNRSGINQAYAMEALGRMMQAEPADPELEALFWSIARDPRLATGSPSLYNRTMCTLGELAWRDEGFLPRAHQEDPDAWGPLLRGLELSTRSLLRSALKNPDLHKLDKPWLLSWPLGCNAEAALALMQLRRVAPDAPELRAGEPRLRRLGRTLRTLDGVLARADPRFRPKATLRLEVRPPDALSRVSPVIYAASAFLTGEQDTAMIQICEVTDE